MRAGLSAVICALVLLACSTTQSVTPVATRPAGFAAWSDAPAPYRFGPGDHVKVQFRLTPELDETALVEPDGSIGLRAAGHVLAAGRTATQLEADIATAAAARLNNPEVTVSLADAGAAQIYVGGAVSKPGAFPLLGRPSVLGAVIMAGGLATDARMNQVALIRRSPDGGPMLRIVDLQKQVSHGTDAGDVPLMASDIVFVPRSHIGELDLWVDQFITKALPFNRDFGYVVNKTATTGIFP
jgi:protein involved in polysaccharide export with SLBB domain